MAALVFAEIAGGRLGPSVRNALAAAARCAEQVDVVLVGNAIDDAVAEAALLPRCRTVFAFDGAFVAEGSVEDIEPSLLSLVRDYTHLVAASSTLTRALFPRLAAILGVAMASDVIEVTAPHEFVRPLYAGNALASVELTDPLKVLTVRVTAFDPVSGRGNAQVVRHPAIEPARRRSTVRVEPAAATTRPDLSAARVVVAAGRGLKSASDFPLVERLADLLGGAVAASRPLVDLGYIGAEHQVGQTGKIVAPELYIAAGVSGQIQHIAGMKDSKVIVAINSDPDAPIFQYASYGLVGNMYEQIPALCDAIERLASSS
jgi:electron transfer flavoprotein alpha subunit